MPGCNISDPFQLPKWLRQGCSLPPLVFNLYLEVRLKDRKRSCIRINIFIGDRYRFTLNFTDAQVVIAQDTYDLEFILRKLYNIYQEWGLNINIIKTEYLLTNFSTHFQIMVEGNSEIKEVAKFKNLGAT